MLSLTELNYVRLRDFHRMRQIMDAKEKTTYDMVKQSLQDLLTRESIRTDEIDSIIYSHCLHSHPGSFFFLEQLKQDLGLEGIPAFEISDLNCATTSLAIKMGKERLSTSDKPYALLLFGEKAFTPLLRTLEDITIVSDAAAACLLKRDAESDHILHVTHYIDGNISNTEVTDEESFRWFQTSYFLGIKKVILQSLKATGLKIEDVKLFIPHNVNYDTWEYMAKAMNLPLERLYLKNIADQGHANGTDTILNTEDVYLEGLLERGDYYLFLSIGRGGAYGCVVLQH
ncbi:3-oxoacyl-[acyl-carrier-protein] synthase III C-terminal domain-containing protein [Paenibacillus sp.]|jgi:3-oxoacyl-[acyl-carrier-protein] synthase III|uniref:3-oxoacyl-[acyl-carrier-protein] synthase III C-terminal domain-containing protein n=1 Tax=Paenibacillus sp. TaxID=58172 RepID=UPI00282C9C52|nr:3-oxoacyl-[acyl-carrier-protein] synthase III C-terminal domain-containing protein [Paenibacillus sp.]MDR0267465.1 hypothetical protein [Paenibacillus sp.]